MREAIDRLPPPFRRESFRRLRRGTYDSAETDVYLNEKSDFAFLHPRPETDYAAYRPRVQALGLRDYKRTLAAVERRFEKIRDWFTPAWSVLEIGAADAAFLAHVRRLFPRVELASVEVDQTTRASRDAVSGLQQYGTLPDVREAGASFDLVCMFHVLEHILDPVRFLDACRACLRPGGRILIEVPSLDDPLLSLYGSKPYGEFYFQTQHPYVYSASSLIRLLEGARLRPEKVIHHQRYGLENHLHWLSKEEPGGSTAFRDVFAGCEDAYLRCLEQSGHADAVIVVAREAA